MAELKLSEKQHVFAANVALLILHLHDSGFGVTFGEAYRTPEQAAWNKANGKGIANSLHTVRLAVDLNLFLSGVYLKDSLDYTAAGAFWKTLHPLNRWGGDFNAPDGNHFSMEHGGVK